jgi:hypothetical protein
MGAPVPGVAQTIVVSRLRTVLELGRPRKTIEKRPAAFSRWRGGVVLARRHFRLRPKIVSRHNREICKVCRVIGCNPDGVILPHPTKHPWQLMG